MNLTRTPALVYGAPPQVNLLPPAERRRRDQADLIRRWGLVAAAAAAVVVLAVVIAALLEASARGDLEAEQARTTSLAGTLGTYQDVAAATREKGAYESYRSGVMKTDVRWSRALGALQAALPDGARITAFDAVVGDDASAAAGGADGSEPLPQAAPSGAVMTVVTQVTSMLPLDQKAMVAAFAQVPGVLAVDLGSLSSQSSASYTSETTVYFDSSVLSGKYEAATR